MFCVVVIVDCKIQSIKRCELYQLLKLQDMEVVGLVAFVGVSCI